MKDKWDSKNFENGIWGNIIYCMQMKERLLNEDFEAVVSNIDEDRIVVELEKYLATLEKYD